MSLREKLQRFKGQGHLTQETPKKPVPAATEISHWDKWHRLQAKPYYLDEEYVILREVVYPLEEKHGRYRFAQLLDIMEAWEEKGIPHPLSTAHKKAEDLLFFDTETTGLHGGTGNTIFLLGYSRFAPDHVLVRQHFLPAPHAELVLYQSFLDAVNEATDLVTYNGKAFDWPQVKTRHTLLRDAISALPVFGHVDLLHGARRLWKHELPSCRLSIVEKEKLGIIRESDVPGSMAPMLYFEYMQERDPEIMEGILMHNEKDVLSLITLYIHISTLLLSHDEQSSSMDERFEIAKWYESLGAEEQALHHYRTIARSSGRRKVLAMAAMGHIFKKQKSWEKALAAWERVMRESSFASEEIYVETAKIYEHQFKDYEKALYFTKCGMEVWKKKSSLLRYPAKSEWNAYLKRVERLEKRITSK